MSARIRPLLPGLALAAITPTALSYAHGWAEMSPLLHPHLHPANGWGLVATTMWSVWATPVPLACFAGARWGRRRAGRSVWPVPFEHAVRNPPPLAASTA